MTYLFLIVGGGDCEIGLDKENTRRLLELVQKARIIAQKDKENSLWRPIGGAEFSWSDHADQSESGEDSGFVSIESNGYSTRMVFQTKKWDWAPYVATFDSAVLDELATLLSRAVEP